MPQEDAGVAQEEESTPDKILYFSVSITKRGYFYCLVISL